MYKKLLAVIALAAAQAAGAQSTQPGPRWQAWIGCWNAVSNAQAWDWNNGAPNTVCVLPTPDYNVAEIVTMNAGKVLGRNRVDASGEAHPITANGCTGREQARFSTDGRRVFLKSSVDCQGAKTETSALLAIAATGDWIDARSVSSGGNSSVKVARFRDAGTPQNLPADILAAVGDRGLGAQGGRIAASGAINNEAIIEASHLVEPGVVEAWIMESGQRFAVDAASIMQLADAGVPGSITDAMIDVSSGKQHAVSYATYGGRYTRPYGRGASDWWDQDTGERIVFYSYPSYDPWGFGYGFGYPFGLTARYGNRYGYNGVTVISNYGYGWGYGYGFAPGYTHGVSYYYPPVIVLHEGSGGTYEHGKAVKGGGYTEGRTAQATPGSSSSGRGQSAAPSGSTPAPAPAAAPSPTPASSSGRTAKTRP